MNNFNPLQSYLGGLQAGEERQARSLASALSGSDNPQMEPEFARLLELDPKRAMQIINLSEAQNASIVNQQLRDTKEILYHASNGDVNSIVGKIQSIAPRYTGEREDRLAGLLNMAQQGDLEGIASNMTNYLKLFDPTFKVEKADNYDGFTKDIVTDIRTGLKDVRKRATDIVGSYQKINKLLDVDKPSRIDISSAITSMARLVSPGIVTDKDFQALSNSGAPLQEIISQLRGFGSQGEGLADALNRSLDPTNPELFNKQAFLNTASRLISSEIPSIMDNYADYQSTASRAGLNTQQMNTLFGGQQKMIERLSSMQFKTIDAEPAPSDSDALSAEEKQELERLRAELNNG